MTRPQKSFWENTQNFLLTLGNPRAQLIINIKNDLEIIQVGISHRLKSLDLTDLRSLKNLRKVLLNDVNKLRVNNHPEASLKVIETARNHGITSSQLEAERAKALTALNQHEKAILIWQEQASSDKLKIKQQANTEIKIYEQNHRLAIDLLQSLRTALQSEMIEIKYLPEIAPRQLSALENPILNESIELRNNNNENLSLKILEIAIQHGMCSNLINENKARALFKVDRKRDAIHIWQSLLSSNNERVKESAQRILIQLGQNLLATLKKTITNKQQPIRCLPEKATQDLSKLGSSILNEAIALRKEKKEQLSLHILEITTSAGFVTDAINENIARALINLKRNNEAVQLLQELLSSEKKETKASAERILQLLGKNLLEQAKKLLTTNGWQIRYLPDEAPRLLSEVEPAFLKEAIALRKENQEKLSLSILDLSIKSGLKTERIDDNRARALVNDEQYFEAVTIWNSLKDSKNAQIQKSAISMLNRFGDKGYEQGVLQKVDAILRSKRDKGQALELLTDAILQSPSNHKIHEKLGEVALINKSKDHQSGQEFEELSAHYQSLAGFEAFVSALEQRYKPALKGAN